MPVGKTMHNVVEVDASSQVIQIVYRKRMQQLSNMTSSLGEMTKPTNCAKFLMIEQPTI